MFRRVYYVSDLLIFRLAMEFWLFFVCVHQFQQINVDQTKKNPPQHNFIIQFGNYV